MKRKRVEGLIESCERKGLDAFFVTREPNIFYFAGTISGGIFILSPDEEPTLLVPSLNHSIAEDQAEDVEVKSFTRQNFLDLLTGICNELKPSAIGFDELSLGLYQNLEKKLEKVELKSEPDLIWEMRKVKDNYETRLMEKAAELSDLGMEAIRQFLREGAREHEVAAEATYAMRRDGAEDISFPFIVASGPRSAYPHAGVTDRKIRRGDFVTIDMGAKYNNYCSDLTRTFIVGSPSKKKRLIYETVLEAQNDAFPEILENAKGPDVDKVARTIIEEKGYGKFFIHSLGHGVGLEVHEPPSLSEKSEDILVAGNMVTDEPGIYIPRFGGVRIEDLVLVTDSAPKRLTKFDRELDSIII